MCLFALCSINFTFAESRVILVAVQTVFGLPRPSPVLPGKPSRLAFPEILASRFYVVVSPGQACYGGETPGSTG